MKEEAAFRKRAASGEHMLSDAQHMLSDGEHTIAQLSTQSQSTISNPQSTNINPQSTNINLQSTNINLQSANINPQTPTVKERESIPGSASYQLEGFVPPSLQQVKAFVFQEGLRILPEDFVDYYTANGWRIGQQPIQDWKAVARRWSRKETDHGGNTFAGIDLGQSC